MSGVDIAHLKQWVGKETSDVDTLSVRHAHLMAATLGFDASALSEGAPLPPLWHWIYFLNGSPPSELGRDGHPSRGGFLPPVPLPNRMWAGGSIEFVSPLPLGASVEKRSRIVSVEHKQGRSGELVFVTVRHELLHEGRTAISEHHDIVYKEPAPQGPRPPSPTGPTMPTAQHSRPFEPTSTTLFRYSALTFNGHRIHYDADYCREVEGYDNLVIHGPLHATLLAMYAEEIASKPLRTFRYRGMQPSLLGAALRINAHASGSDAALWTALPDGSVSMQADATFI
jgi:3-methylfumaryl-CoA hydratase